MLKEKNVIKFRKEYTMYSFHGKSVSRIIVNNRYIKYMYYIISNFFEVINEHIYII
jgi:hypothetical protein